MNRTGGSLRAKSQRILVAWTLAAQRPFPSRSLLLRFNAVGTELTGTVRNENPLEMSLYTMYYTLDIMHYIVCTLYAGHVIYGTCILSALYYSRYMCIYIYIYIIPHKLNTVYCNLQNKLYLL